MLNNKRGEIMAKANYPTQVEMTQIFEIKDGVLWRRPTPIRVVIGGLGRL